MWQPASQEKLHILEAKSPAVSPESGIILASTARQWSKADLEIHHEPLQEKCWSLEPPDPKNGITIPAGFPGGINLHYICPRGGGNAPEVDKNDAFA